MKLIAWGTSREALLYALFGKQMEDNPSFNFLTAATARILPYLVNWDTHQHKFTNKFCERLHFEVCPEYLKELWKHNIILDNIIYTIRHRTFFVIGQKSILQTIPKWCFRSTLQTPWTRVFVFFLQVLVFCDVIHCMVHGSVIYMNFTRRDPVMIQVLGVRDLLLDVKRYQLRMWLGRDPPGLLTDMFPHKL